MIIKGKIARGRTAEVYVKGEHIARLDIRSPRRGPGRSPGDEIRLAPGFIDLQVNGFAGVDFNHPDFSAKDMVGACRSLLKTGVTRFCPTLITAGYNQLERTIGRILEACNEHPLVRSMVLGIHLEGPYINPEDGPRGAHPLAHVGRPDWEKFERLLSRGEGLVRMVTVAPELPGCLEFIRKAAQIGLVVGLGHCNPEPADVDQAVHAGAVISTHLGNAAHRLLDRSKNYLQKQLAHDRLMASIICDGLHLPDYFVKNVVRAKGKSRVVLITDATAASNAPAGRYSLGGIALEACDDGALRLPGTPYLAGSTLTMDRAVGFCARFAGIPLTSAIDMATTNPARLFAGTGGELEEGQRADLVLFRAEKKKIQIERVYLAGKLMYERS
ncbi:MAG: N-acetylglucosamine-6-phosphate deacetylase [Desulfobacteraceae bacterium]|nr:MAG: N-acetylglucosamine-6-phosphate deacetylase [Desulfobacteraceae bacterium]